MRGKGFNKSAMDLYFRHTSEDIFECKISGRKLQQTPKKKFSNLISHLELDHLKEWKEKTVLYMADHNKNLRYGNIPILFGHNQKIPIYFVG